MAERKRMLRIGESVIIRLDKNDCAVTPGMWEYDGCEAVISKITKSVHGRISQKGYELKDVVSPYGIPYAFTRDMIEAEGEDECQ